MKRTFSLFLIMLVLMTCLIIPVAADENSTGNWIELLDYGTVNSTGTNVFSFTGSKVVSWYFLLDLNRLAMSMSFCTPLRL